MPYKSPEHVEEKVRGTEKLTEKQRRQFIAVFNSCWDKHKDDATCHKMAWGVVKKNKKGKAVMGDKQIYKELIDISKILMES
jgi:cation transport regulator ChaB